MDMLLFKNSNIVRIRYLYPRVIKFVWEERSTIHCHYLPTALEHYVTYNNYIIYITYRLQQHYNRMLSRLHCAHAGMRMGIPARFLAAVVASPSSFSFQPFVHFVNILYPT